MSKAIISIPKDAKVFIVEDDPSRRDWFTERLGARVYGFFDKPEEAISHLNDLASLDPGPVQLESIYAFFFDHDLGGAYKPPYSTDIAKRLYELDPEAGRRTVIHSMNEPGARNLQMILPGAVYFPFGFFDIKDLEDKEQP